MSELTEKQKRFADEYLKDLNAKQAAIRSGYSEKTAEFQASRLLSKDKVQAYLDSKRAKLEKKTEITQEWVLTELKKQYESATDVREFQPALKALEMLGKHLGLFAERLKLGGDDKGIPIDIRKQSTLEQINERIKTMLGRK